jgi:F0F1-type ATP synthase assembly protein I
MPKQGSDEWLNTILNKYVKAPILVIFGMAIVGILIDSFAGTGNTFKIIFLSIGGVSVVAYYFREFWVKKK